MAKEGQIFSLDQLHQKTRIKKEILRVIVSRWEKKGFVERIERGTYLIIPLESEKGKYTVHEFVIASHLVRPYAIAYWSALHYHGLTEQIPGTVFIQTPTRKKETRTEVFGVEYQIVRVKQEKIYGLRREWIEETPIGQQNTQDPGKEISSTRPQDNTLYARHSPESEGPIPKLRQYGGNSVRGGKAALRHPHPV